MASPAPNDTSSNSPPDSSSASNPGKKAAEDLVAWALAHQNGPAHCEKTERRPGEKRVGHGGPIRIAATNDGVLTEYGKNPEQERLAELAAANDNEGGKKARSFS